MVPCQSLQILLCRVLFPYIIKKLLQFTLLSKYTTNIISYPQIPHVGTFSFMSIVTIIVLVYTWHNQRYPQLPLILGRESYCIHPNHPRTIVTPRYPTENINKNIHEESYYISRSKMCTDTCLGQFFFLENSWQLFSDRYKTNNKQRK